MWWPKSAKIQWFLILSLIFVIWCFFSISKHSEINGEHFSFSTTKEYVREFTPALNKKYVTKSLKQLGKMDELNKYFLFLNFIPKSGAEILIYLLERIQGLNNFKHVRLKGGRGFLEEYDQENLVNQMYDIRKNEAIPLTFDKNVYFTNFAKFGRQSPTYFNLIRDPVEKVFAELDKHEQEELKSCISFNKKNCSLSNLEQYDFSIPFFCGHNSKCLQFNSLWALQTAKKNVEKFYLVVGTAENISSTLDVLENKLPYFFKGTKDLYHKYLYGINKQRKKPEISLSSRKSAEKVLKTEVEFYQWIRERLNNQVNNITKTLKRKTKNAFT